MPIKNFTFIFLAAVILLGCKSSTDPEKYNNSWSPFINTKWYKVAKGSTGLDTLVQITTTNEPNFAPGSKGFEYLIYLKKDTTLTFAFAPSTYIVTNPQTVSSADLSFRTYFENFADTVVLKDSTRKVYSFGMLSGKVKTVGTSADTATYSFPEESVNAFPLTVNPDKFSKRLLVYVTVQWKLPAIDPATVARGLTTSGVTGKIVMKGMTMNVYDIELIKN